MNKGQISEFQVIHFGEIPFQKPTQWGMLSAKYKIKIHPLKCSSPSQSPNVFVKVIAFQMSIQIWVRIKNPLMRL